MLPNIVLNFRHYTIVDNLTFIFLLYDPLYLIGRLRYISIIEMSSSISQSPYASKLPTSKIKCNRVERLKLEHSNQVPLCTPPRPSLQCSLCPNQVNNHPLDSQPNRSPLTRSIVASQIYIRNLTSSLFKNYNP